MGILTRCALSFTVGVSLAMGAVSVSIRRERLAYEDRIATLNASVGSGCEPIYAALWVDYDCPPLTPSGVRSFVCTPKARLYRSAALEKTLTKVRSLGTGAAALSLYEEKGAKESELALEWDPEVRR